MGRKHQFIGGIIGADPLVAPPSIDVLVVGGGSARTKVYDFQHYASGGCGGSIIRRTGLIGNSYQVTIGLGAVSVDGKQSSNHLGPDGGSTSFGSLTAAGGVALNSNHDAFSYTNKTSADIDGTVTSYSAAAGTGGFRGASGSGAGGSATSVANNAATGGGAAYIYSVNGTVVDNDISGGGSWMSAANQASAVSSGTPYGHGGQGGSNNSCPGGDGVVYVAYPTSSISSYVWTGATSDLTPITSVADYTVLRITGDGNFSVAA